MTIRAKFRCTSVEKLESFRYKRDDKGQPMRDELGNLIHMEQFLYTAKFNPVADNSPENKQFWEASPSGSFVLTSILVDAFEPGVEYYLDIRPAVATTAA